MDWNDVVGPDDGKIELNINLPAFKRQASTVSTAPGFDLFRDRSREQQPFLPTFSCLVQYHACVVMCTVPEVASPVAGMDFDFVAQLEKDRAAPAASPTASIKLSPVQNNRLASFSWDQAIPGSWLS